MEKNKGILLESGTNELEIVEFTVGENTFGINVAKVREIMPFTKVTKVPNSHPCIKGIFKPREMVMTVIDLPKYLNLPTSEDETKNLFIITNFNKLHSAFQVHTVEGIHRISWTDIEKPDNTIYGGQEGLATGIVKIEGKLIIILDFEKIMSDIAPQVGIKMAEIDKMGVRTRSDKPILVAEDSELLERMIYDALTRAGYTNITMCANGLEAWNKIESFKNEKGRKIKEKLACIITDIEMPQMDGHRLTKMVKEDEILSEIPVIIFSSLINEDMRRKGEALGADAQITKPEIGNLVGLIDKLTGNIQ